MTIDFIANTPRAAALAALLISCLGGVQAQTVYRIVGPDGRITFSDRPPSSASQVAPVGSGGADATAQNATLPYALRQVVAKYPVTLYSGNDCAPCDEGRNLLRARGVPFAEKTVSSADDVQALQRLANTSALPLLTIGAQQLKGFAAADWQQFLGIAGYPATSQLPASYRNPSPQPLVALQAAPAARAAASAPEPTQPAPTPVPPRISPSNPAGIQF